MRKGILYYSYNNKIEEYKISNPDKANEMKHQLEVLKTGHTPISFIMEKVLHLKSFDFLKYQKSYFFIILTFLSLIISIFNKPQLEMKIEKD